MSIIIKFKQSIIAGTILKLVLDIFELVSKFDCIRFSRLNTKSMFPHWAKHLNNNKKEWFAHDRQRESVKKKSIEGYKSEPKNNWNRGI